VRCLDVPENCKRKGVGSRPKEGWRGGNSAHAAENLRRRQRGGCLSRKKNTLEGPQGGVLNKKRLTEFRKDFRDDVSMQSTVLEGGS